jgi:predicted PilT family ATPase
MRNLRWAAELAVSGDPNKARLGVAQLRALNESDLLDSEQQGFIDAALTAVVKESVSDVELAREDAKVIPLPDSRIGIADRVTTELSSVDESADDEGGPK